MGKQLNWHSAFIYNVPYQFNRKDLSANPLLNVCVYCGSSSGRDDVYTRQAKQLGKLLVQNNMGLIYGGAKIGVMGAIADTVIREGGSVTGIIPEQLVDREVAHNGLTQMHIVNGMHERKALMAEKADAFVALPGGFGTLDELFEILTWSQLGIHQKPCGLLNIGGYFDALETFINNAVKQGFVRSEHKERLRIHQKTESLVTEIKEHHTSRLNNQPLKKTEMPR